MEFPQRTADHIKETRSMKALDRRLPPAWMLRHVTERDYGLDCLVELVTTNGELLGDVAAIQLKGTDELKWRNEKDVGEVATFSNIKSATVNYWMGLPTPVFLCVHSEADDEVFFAPVKLQARRKYDELRSQDSISLTIRRSFTFTKGLEFFVLLYLQEKMRPLFASAMTTLIVHRKTWISFAQQHVGSDEFLPIEKDDELTFISWQRSLRIVVDHLGLDADFPKLQELIDEDIEKFGEENRWGLCFMKKHWKELS